MPADDPYDLARFVRAQDRNGTFDAAVAELRRGRKTTHWMWFVFPQVAGLGRSAMSQDYAISTLDEARAYLQHPVLGGRLRECAGVVAAISGSSADDVFGGVDAQKLQSSMTLFALAAPEGEHVFEDVLLRLFGGQYDANTEQLV